MAKSKSKMVADPNPAEWDDQVVEPGSSAKRSYKKAGKEVAKAKKLEKDVEDNRYMRYSDKDNDRNQARGEKKLKRAGKLRKKAAKNVARGDQKVMRDFKE